MKKMLTTFLAVLLVFTLLPVSALAIEQSDIDALEDLVKEAEQARDDAASAEDKITGKDGYLEEGKEAQQEMYDELADATSSTAALDGLIASATEAVDMLEGIVATETNANKNKAVSATEDAIDDVIDTINDVVDNINDAIDEANKVVDNANLATVAAADAVSSAETAMAKAEEANKLYLQLLADSEGDMDDATFAAIAEAEKNTTDTWNAYADAQNDALAAVITAVEKAEEAKNTATKLYDAWRDAVNALEGVVAGTEFEYLQDLRDAALMAAVGARDSAIEAVLAAGELQEMAIAAQAAFDITDQDAIGTSLIASITDYTKEIKEVIKEAEKVADDLTIKKDYTITSPPTGQAKGSLGTTNDTKLASFEIDDDFYDMIPSKNGVKTFVMILANGDTVTFFNNRGMDEEKWYVYDSISGGKGSVNLTGITKDGKVLISFENRDGKTVYYALTLDGKLGKETEIESFKKAEPTTTKVPAYKPKDFCFDKIDKVNQKRLAKLTGKTVETLESMSEGELEALFMLFNIEWDWEAPIVINLLEEPVDTVLSSFTPVAAPVPVPYGVLEPEGESPEEVPYGMVKTGQGIEQQALALGLGFVLMSLGALVMKRPRKKNEEAK